MGIVSTGIVTYWIFGRGKDKEVPTTEAWVYEAHGGCWPCLVTNETSSEIEFDIKYSPKMKPQHMIVSHSHPFAPIGTMQRVFMIPRGSLAADNPADRFAEGQDQDDPYPLVQSSASFYNRLASMMGSAGLKLKENWFTLLLLATSTLFAGMFLQANYHVIP